MFVGSAGFKPLLLPVLDKLAKDEYDAVRKPIASGFHEVSTYFTLYLFCKACTVGVASY